MAREIGHAPSTVHRIWHAFGLQPHRVEMFKLSSAPLFVEKVRDIVGFYLSPPERAIVLCVDEKSQVQALDRTQLLLPMRPGQAERRTHDDKRHGTTALFAALDVKAPTIVGKCMPRHRASEFRKFLDEVEGNVPADLDIHVMDNYGMHKTKRIRREKLGSNRSAAESFRTARRQAVPSFQTNSRAWPASGARRCPSRTDRRTGSAARRACHQ